MNVESSFLSSLLFLRCVKKGYKCMPSTINKFCNSIKCSSIAIDSLSLTKEGEGESDTIASPKMSAPESQTYIAIDCETTPTHHLHNRILQQSYVYSYSKIFYYRKYINVTCHKFKLQEKRWTYLRLMEAGKMNASRTPTVAPVNSKATHTVGINIAPKRIITTSPCWWLQI